MGGLGGGAPQNFFAILGAKILLENTKKTNKQGGVKTTVKISRDITVMPLPTLHINSKYSAKIYINEM